MSSRSSSNKSSSLDEKERSLARSSVGWTLLIGLLSSAVVVILIAFVLSFLMLSSVNSELTRLNTAMVNVQSDLLRLEERQLSTDETKEQFEEMLLEYAEKRVKRSAASPNQSSEVTVNVAHVFGSFIKQMCKPESAICIPGQPGRDGLPGLSGRDGPIGLQGPPGRDGRTGLSGAAGRKGEAGRNGERGSKGSAGKQGPRGIAGRKGDMGVSGEKGDRGERGERGVGGLHGILGPRGEKGEEGDKGERGYPGFKGGKGGKGEIGLQGEKGMKGDKGDEQDLHQLSNLPSQCLPWNYRVLNETWRQTSEHYTKTTNHCDQTGSSDNQHGFTPGWHSFSHTIGGAMPEKCTSKNYCGTNASGWLKGSHPNVIGQNISRTVCFNWSSNCCYWQTSVEVINCGQYYIYNLPNTPVCHSAYCARGQ